MGTDCTRECTWSLSTPISTNFTSRLPRVDGADGVHEVGAGTAFQDVPLRPRPHGPGDVRFGVQGRQHEDAGVGGVPAYRPDQLDAVHVGQLKIEERDFGPVFFEASIASRRSEVSATILRSGV